MVNNPGMERTRVVLANDPRSYREIIASALQALRPNIEVLMIEPESLDDLLVSLSPDLVICSRLTAAVDEGARSWVELYPEGERLVVMSIRGRRRTLGDVELSHLLSIVDAAVKGTL